MLLLILFLFSTITLAADNTFYATFSLHNHENRSRSAHTLHTRAAIRQHVHHRQTYQSPASDLHTYSSNQLKDYFSRQRYTEKDILSQNTLYMSDEFVKLIKKYPGYETAVTTLYNKMHTMSFWEKVGSWINGNYCTGLDKRITKLYEELNHTKQPTTSSCQSITYDSPFNCRHNLITALESHKDISHIASTLQQIAKHILGIELISNKGKILSKINGFHHDLMHYLEKSNLVEFSNKVLYENGFYKATLLYNGDAVKYVATFFPAHWPREKVVKKILEAYKNFLKKNIIPPLKKGKYKIQGTIEEGIEIEICITQNGRITTAYPILK